MLHRVLELLKKFYVPHKMGSLGSHTCRTPGWSYTVALYFSSWQVKCVSVNPELTLLINIY